MARPIRVEFEGAVYHVTARGNERRLIYRDDRDRRRFLETLEEAVQQNGLRVHGYCLMPNHYHLLVETPRGNLCRSIGWLQTTYSIRFNRRHRRSGHLFQGRFKAHLVEADSYAMELLRYVHLNPVRPRHKTVPIPPEQRAALKAYRWSSHGAYSARAEAPPWLCTDWLSFFAARRLQAQQEYQRFIGDAFGEVLASPWEKLRLGLVLGGDALVERAAQLLRGKPHQEEIRWTVRHENAAHRIAAGQAMAKEQPERAWRVWIRVRLGAERRIDVARAVGYKDGSAITHQIKRLEADVATQPAVATRMARLRRTFAKTLSSFKS
jgi:putative transposase